MVPEIIARSKPWISIPCCQKSARNPCRDLRAAEFFLDLRASEFRKWSAGGEDRNQDSRVFESSENGRRHGRRACRRIFSGQTNQVGIFRVKLVHQTMRGRGMVLRNLLDEGFVIQAWIASNSQSSFAILNRRLCSALILCPLPIADLDCLLRESLKKAEKSLHEYSCGARSGP